jgi:hypothetical protein
VRSFVNWTDPSDPTVVACLAVKCRMCKSDPGIPCASIIDNRPLPNGRVVHAVRMDGVIKP